MATLDISPTKVTPGQTRVVQFILNAGTWGAAPTLTPSGAASTGVSIGTVTLVNPTLATASVTYGTATGTLTWTESSGSATRNQLVGALVHWVPRRLA
jgi:hypothetical protein